MAVADPTVPPWNARELHVAQRFTKQAITAADAFWFSVVRWLRA